MDTIDRRVLLGAAGLVGVAAVASVARGGPLTPPVGPITPTGKTLDQVEPRKDALSLPGSALFQHVISEPGSYILSANLVVPAGAGGILITVSNVTLDLNGFTIRGQDGATRGVVANSIPGPDQIRNITIANGHIENFQDNGISAGDSSVGLRFENLSIRQCGIGMYIWQAIANNCRVLDCGTGVLAYESNLTNCGANNCGAGFSLVNSRLSESSSNFGGTALDLDSGSVATGIQISGAFNGVFLRARSVVRNCHFADIASYGVEVWRDFGPSGKENVIDNNTFIRCAVGAILCNGAEAQGNLITSNRASNSGPTAADAFLISTSNRYGPIVVADALPTGDLSTLPAASHPLANIVY